MSIDDTQTFTIDVLPGMIQNSLGHEWTPTEQNLITAMAEVKVSPRTPENPGWVHLPTCSITLTTQLYMFDYFHLFGNGPGNTFLNTNTSGNFIPIRVYDSTGARVSDVGIDNLTIDMHNLGSNAFYLPSATNINLHHLNINRPGYQGIYASGGSTGTPCYNIILNNINVTNGSNTDGGHAFSLTVTDYCTASYLHAENMWSGYDLHCKNSLFENISLHNYIGLGCKNVTSQGGFMPYNNTFRNWSISRSSAYSQTPAYAFRIMTTQEQLYENFIIDCGGAPGSGLVMDTGLDSYHNSFNNIHVKNCGSDPGVTTGFSLAGNPGEALGHHTANNITVENCQQGFYIIGSTGCTMSNFTVTGCTFPNRVKQCTGATLNGNSTIADQTGNALEIHTTDNTMLDGLHIWYNTADGINLATYGANTNYTIQNSIIRNNNVGIRIGASDDYVTIINNQFCYNPGGDILNQQYPAHKNISGNTTCS